MTRSRAFNRFHRFLARRHRQSLRCSLPEQHAGSARNVQRDVSDRLMLQALRRDQKLEGLDQEPTF